MATTTIEVGLLDPKRMRHDVRFVLVKAPERYPRECIHSWHWYCYNRSRFCGKCWDFEVIHPPSIKY